MSVVVIEFPVAVVFPDVDNTNVVEEEYFGVKYFVVYTKPATANIAIIKII